MTARSATLARPVCAPLGSLAPPAPDEWLCRCGEVLRPIPATSRDDWIYVTASGESARNDTPPALTADPRAWWAELAAEHMEIYSSLTAAVQLGWWQWSHAHQPERRVDATSTGEVPWCCDSPMWARPSGWACRVGKTSFAYGSDGALDVSLGQHVASAPVTTSTSSEIKILQDRQADARERVINAACMNVLERNNFDDDSVATAVQAALMELVEVWRDEAKWWESSGKRGAKGTAATLRECASRVAGFAVGLADAPREHPSTSCEHPADALSVSKTTGVTRCTRCATNIRMPSTSAAAPATIADFLAGKVDVLPVAGDAATLVEQVMRPDTEQEAILTIVNSEPVSAFAPTATQLVDSPFSSPATPGRLNKRPVGRLPFVALEALSQRLREGEEARDHVSHSFVGSYAECGVKALLGDASRAGLVVPRRPGWALIGGSAFHAAVERIERGFLAGDGLPIPEAIGIIWTDHLDAAVKTQFEALAGSAYADASTWHVANSGKEGFDWWRVEGEAMLRAYVAYHSLAWRETHRVLLLPPAAGETTPRPVIEFPYTMTVRSLDGTAGVEARGFIDIAWLDTTTMQITVADFKSGKSTPDETFQLGEYAHALEMEMPAPPTKPVLGSFWHARKGEYTPAIEATKAHPLEELQYRYGTAMRGYKAGVFAAAPSNFCSSCGSVDICPAQARRDA